MRALKQPGDSFSDVVHKLVERTRKKPIAEFFGKWPGTAREAARIKKTLEKDRRHFKTREAKFE